MAVQQEQLYQNVQEDIEIHGEEGVSPILSVHILRMTIQFEYSARNCVFY